MSIGFILQQIINGFSLGSMYALIAIGYTLVYGVLRLINFAHGDIMMVGAFMAFIFFKILGLNFYVAVLFSIIFTAIVGILTYVSAYKPLLDKGAPKISLLITAIGISFFLESLFNVIANQYLGGTYQAFYFPKWFSHIIHIGNVTIPVLTIIVPVLTLLLLGVVLFILYKTKVGIAIRALAFDITTVKLMGANSNMIIAFVFALGSALAAIGGIAYAMAYPSIDPYMGMLVGLKAFAAAVVGGIGSVTGAVIGGFILGFAEVAIPGFFPELGGWKDAFAFIFLIFVLLFKPTGIMGIDFERQRF
ncbi:branched-chain amino acid ABC transporter permease [Caminibacter pacificus]|uniref:Amino acid/amide ABC transporter membrane protein 1 (HAAT family) n=1 Tax=Caminibacter pacificus TaxID=1424653 RepID=A0AAJ4RB42_9BACT|nr:branched-chain amino acid ABC transporter permease [Caminibacter pacificus]NPA88164.1 branched-chain amino acid ABC transporter permease [Campylobacterota bacterium]QCI27473.1 branched-chain amino acid ABC transporter permease [Caminibacter pacificus]ROR38911.1 amino acid/amide ABC transporter membrane protein 1 (HAAT family) [Caminibacter pacificus]